MGLQKCGLFEGGRWSGDKRDGVWEGGCLCEEIGSGGWVVGGVAGWGMEEEMGGVCGREERPPPFSSHHHRNQLRAARRAPTARRAEGEWRDSRIWNILDDSVSR